MSTADRGGLKAAFARFKQPEGERDAERKLLGREVEAPAELSDAKLDATSKLPATSQLPGSTVGLIPRPLLHKEAVRQLSFRCPVSLAMELRKKAAFNQLDQQEIIIAGLRAILATLEAPPEGWEH